MIKEKMTQPLLYRDDTVGLEITENMLAATDEELEPYAAGYVPYDMIKKCNAFNWRQFTGSFSNYSYGFNFELQPIREDFQTGKGMPFAWQMSDTGTNRDSAVSVQPQVKSSATGQWVTASYSQTAWMETQVVNPSSDISNRYTIAKMNFLNLWKSHSFTFPTGYGILKMAGVGLFIGENGYEKTEKSTFQFSLTYDVLTDTVNEFSGLIGISGNQVTLTFNQDDYDAMPEDGSPYTKDVVFPDGRTKRFFFWISGYHQLNQFAPSYFEDNANWRTSYITGTIFSSGFVFRWNCAFGSFAEGYATSTDNSGYYQAYARPKLTYGNSFSPNTSFTGISTTDWFMWKEGDPEYSYSADRKIETPIFEDGAYLDFGWWNAGSFVTKGYTKTDVKVFSLISTPIVERTIPDPDNPGLFKEQAYTPELNEKFQLTGKWIPLEDQPDLDPDKNDFDPENIPEGDEPDVPPGGEPDEGDRGAAIPAITLGHGAVPMINYARFRADGITELIATLWDSPDSFFKQISVSLGESVWNYFISLRHYPLDISNADIPGGPENVLTLGRGGKLNVDGGFRLIYPDSAFDFGYVTVKRQYNNFLDYAPYTAVSIFLPFAGLFELNPTVVMGRTLNLGLIIDFTTGSGTWEVYNDTDKQPVLIKQCQIGGDFPLTGVDSAQMASNQVNASLRTAQHTINAIGQGAAIAGSLMTGQGALAVGALASQSGDMVFQGLSDAYNKAMASKEIPQYTGGNSGLGAQLVNHTPYIVYRRPLCTNPENYAHAVGNLVDQTAQIGSLKGFTSCRNVDLSGITQATDKEKAQIKKILESGFYA